jgi:hypothetical protein
MGFQFDGIGVNQGGQKPVVYGPLYRVNSNHVDSTACEGRKETPCEPPSVSRFLPSTKFTKRDEAPVRQMSDYATSQELAARK